MTDNIKNPQVVSREEWLVARKAHLQKEKEFTRLRDQLSAERRALPWVKVDKEYIFEGPQGKETLSDLFNGRSQLVVYHFMFAPGWEQGCDGCSFLADHFDGPNLHLPHHDVTLLAVSRAPWQEFQAFKKRMGWQFKWVSSFGSDFNYDYHVSPSEAEIAAGKMYYNYEEQAGEPGEGPGFSVFYKDESGNIFHTYSAYARGGDILINTYNFLELTPKGRNEEEIMDWMRLHDEYEDAQPTKEACCH